MSFLIFAVEEDAGLSATVAVLEDFLSKFGFEVLYKGLPEVDKLDLCASFMATIVWDGKRPHRRRSIIGQVFVVYDLASQLPTYTQRNLYPGIDNARVLLLAYHLTRELSKIRKPTDCAAVWMTGNDKMARECLRTSMPEVFKSVEKLAIEMEASMTSEYAVVRELTKVGAYARVFLIRYKGNLAVEKIFRPSCQRRLEKERIAYEMLSKEVDAIPRLLEARTNSVIIPYIKDELRYSPNGPWLISVSLVPRLLQVLKQLFDAGYSLVDCHPGNLLMDESGEIWMIDFEFLYRYKNRPEAFHLSYDIAGIPDDFEEEMPPGNPEYLRVPWRNAFGFDLLNNLDGVSFTQRMKRFRYWLRWTLLSYCYRKFRIVGRFTLATILAVYRELTRSSVNPVRIVMRP